MAADINAGQRADQQGDQQPPVDIAEKPMAHAGNERQRHCVRQIRRDNSLCRKSRVEENQCGNAQRACSHRGKRNENAEHHPSRNRKAWMAGTERPDRRLRERRFIRVRNASAKPVKISARPSVVVMILELPSPPVKACRPRSVMTADGRLPAANKRGDAPVHSILFCMHISPAGFGDRGMQKVCTHRCRGVNAEEQDEQRRHEGAAANPGESDDDSDDESGQRLGKIDHLRTIEPLFG